MDDRAHPLSPSPSVHKPLGALLWIALYKLLKASAMVVGGVIALRMVHRDLAKVVLRAIEHVHIDPHGHFADRLLARAAHIHPPHLQLLGVICFVYAAIYLTEGVGLFFEKRWAEWLTAVQTSILIPWELIELYRFPSIAKAVVLLLNTLVVAYLLWRIRHDDLEAAAREAAYKR
ncbi:MAG: putative rane protein [Phycisphaerales bacterium]|nr:putative rane protein [Phycisphaerales bacterium]